METLLNDGLALVNQGAGNHRVVRVAPGSHHLRVFDVFPDETGRNAHLNGKVAAALMAKAPDLFVQGPKIEKVDVLASSYRAPDRGRTRLKVRATSSMIAANWRACESALKFWLEPRRVSRRLAAKAQELQQLVIGRGGFIIAVDAYVRDARLLQYVLHGGGARHQRQDRPPDADVFEQLARHLDVGLRLHQQQAVSFFHQPLCLGLGHGAQFQPALPLGVAVKSGVQTRLVIDHADVDKDCIGSLGRSTLPQARQRRHNLVGISAVIKHPACRIYFVLRGGNSWACVVASASKPFQMTCSFDAAHG